MCDINGCDEAGKRTYKSTRHTIGVFRGSPRDAGSMLSHQSHQFCQKHYDDVIAGKIIPITKHRFPEMDAATRLKLKKEKESRG